MPTPGVPKFKISKNFFKIAIGSRFVAAFV
jgi:hypothetical protein